MFGGNGSCFCLSRAGGVVPEEELAVVFSFAVEAAGVKPATFVCAVFFYLEAGGGLAGVAVTCGPAVRDVAVGDFRGVWNMVTAMMGITISWLQIQQTACGLLGRDSLVVIGGFLVGQLFVASDS